MDAAGASVPGVGGLMAPICSSPSATAAGASAAGSAPHGRAEDAVGHDAAEEAVGHNAAEEATQDHTAEEALRDHAAEEANENNAARSAQHGGAEGAIAAVSAQHGGAEGANAVGKAQHGMAEEAIRDNVVEEAMGDMVAEEAIGDKVAEAAFASDGARLSEARAEPIRTDLACPVRSSRRGLHRVEMSLSDRASCPVCSLTIAKGTPRFVLWWEARRPHAYMHPGCLRAAPLSREEARADLHLMQPASAALEAVVRQALADLA